MPWAWWRPRVIGRDVVVAGRALGGLIEGVGPHSARHCDDDPACPLHSPTDHALRSFPVFHGSEANLTVRECAHRQLHPDPDDARWQRASTDHGCDGCCAASR